MLCLAMMGCSSNQVLAPEPTSITLFYGDTSISAGVLEDKTFNSVLADRIESVTFSGSIQKQDSGYLVDMLVIRETKDPTLNSTTKHVTSYENWRASGRRWRE